MERKDALILINKYFKKNMNNEIGKVVTGKYGTYFEMVDSTGHMLMGQGLWLIKPTREIYCVEIPVDNELFDDYIKNRGE